MFTAVLITLAVIAVACLVVLGLFFWRLRAIGSRVGSFECAMDIRGHWRAGIATYTRDHLNWYGVVSLSVSPTRRFNRRELAITGRSRRQLTDGESQVSEARCAYLGEDLLIATNDGALDGLVSWLEASPPDPRTSRVV